MRKEMAFKNALAAILSNVVSIIVGLIAQAIFIKVLGEEYLGVNSLFANIVSMLAIVELGIGSAIIYNLYRPIAYNEIEKIKSLMYFYKKSYRVIAIIIMIIGIVIVPMLPTIVGTVNIDVNIYLIYALFLLDTVASYFLSYKRSILYANQKNYIVNLIHVGYTILLNTFQILVIVLTKNYYLYLVVKLFMRIVENLAITLISNKLYNFLKEKNVKKLDKEIQNDIIKKVKALFYHKIGIFIINGTDNIIISSFLGVAVVGYYSNYYLIINAVQTVFSQIITAASASIGNLLVTDTKEKQFQVFDRIRFLNFYIATFANVCIFNIMDSFITIWIGKEFILSKSVLLILVINNFQKLIRSSYGTFKEAAGVFYEDRYIPLLESLINIIFSIIFVKIFGLTGVFLGTLMSSMTLWCYSYPKFVYKNIFNRKYMQYIKETLKEFIMFFVILYISNIPIQIIKISNNYCQFIFNVIVTVVIVNILLILLYKNNHNLKYYKSLIVNFVKEKRGKKDEENRNNNIS